MAARPGVPSVIARLVPFGAVCVANCINLPYMRRNEMFEGMPLQDDNGNTVGYSPKIGKESIAKVKSSFLTAFLTLKFLALIF